MKTLIAIINARHREEWRTAVRSTWLNQVPRDKCDAFFFMGNGEPREFANDEVALDCSDRYEHLPEKVRAITRWALERDYSHMLKCDDDVVLRPVALLNSGYEKHDFSGKANRPPQPYVVSFGFNYWLSRKAMAIVAEAKLPEDGSNDDEKWVAKNLWDHNIVLVNDDRYKLHTGWEVYPEQTFQRRALRAARITAPIREPQMVSRCIHIEDARVSQKEKLNEFRTVFLKYGEK
jgi:Galactosyltransferase